MIVAGLLIFLAISSVRCLDNGVALTPPMGWMSWQRYRCIIDCVNFPDDCISEKLFYTQADFMVSEGYLDAGYEYLIIDDCWLADTRDENGRLQPNAERFPNGIKNISDHVHKLGLKFGIYEDYGTKTCAGYPGSLGHLKEDAETFAEWDVDYVKLDGCYSDIEDYPKGYPEFGRELNKTGRPIVYSCSWPAYEEVNGKESDYKTISEHCNLWRNYGDIQDSWASMRSITEWFAKHQDRLIPFAGPGHWNDPDMLLIGNFGLSYEQSKTQMAIWAIMAAPLLISTDMGSVRPEMKAIIQNKDIIAVNQDALGIQGKRISKKNGIETWIRPILPMIDNEHTYAIAIVNTKDNGEPTLVNTKMSDLGMNYPNGYILKDLYGDITFSTYKGQTEFKVKVFPSSVAFIHAKPAQ